MSSRVSFWHVCTFGQLLRFARRLFAGPGSHKEAYKCHKQEFIPTPTPDLAATVAKIKAETTPFEFIGDVGDVMLCERSSSVCLALV